MRKTRILLIYIVLLLAGAQQARTQARDSTSIYLADPTVFFQEGVYYLYGTVGENADKGFLVYTSTDLHAWKLSTKNDGYALKKGDVFGESGFWAPQVFSYNGKFYMAYTANEKIAIAESSSPLGPFVQAVRKSLDAPVKQIDPFVFIDEDGKAYLYHVRLSGGNKIFVAEMTDSLRSIRTESLQLCVEGDVGWENTAHSSWPVTEGPSVFKHNGLYYLFYSANDFKNTDYAVGYATSPSPLGPWTKYKNNPVIDKLAIGQNGPGHGDFFRDSKQQLWYVLHTHYSDNRVTPRKTAMMSVIFKKSKVRNMDRLIIDPASFYYLQNEKGSGR